MLRSEPKLFQIPEIELDGQKYTLFTLNMHPGGSMIRPFYSTVSLMEIRIPTLARVTFVRGSAS